MRVTGRYLILASLLAGCACHTMRPVTLDDLIAQPTSRVWVTASDQTVVMLEGAQVFRGRLVGFVNGTYRVVPAADIQKVVARRFAPGKTAGLIAVGAVGFTVALVVLSGSGGYFDPCVGGSATCAPTPTPP